MNKKIKSTILGATAGALLLTGSTYALWSDSGSVGAGTITNGNLDVTSVSAGVWQDVSGTTPVAISDLSAFRMVPGDKIEGTYTLSADLQGDNMVADLAVKDGNAIATVNGVNFSVKVFNADTGDDLGSANGASVRFRSVENDNANAATLPTLDESGTYTVKVTAEMPDTIENRDHVLAETDLGDLKVSLDQVRL